MNVEMKSYCWDRLLRGVVRNRIMSDAQRQDLADFILSQNPSAELEEAVGHFLTGELTEDACLTHYQRVDTAAFRASLAPPPDETRAVDARLKALLEMA